MRNVIHVHALNHQKYVIIVLTNTQINIYLIGMTYQFVDVVYTLNLCHFVFGMGVDGVMALILSLISLKYQKNKYLNII